MEMIALLTSISVKTTKVIKKRKKALISSLLISSFPLLPQTISVAPENPSCLCGFPSIEFVSKQPQSMGRSFFKCCQQEKDLSCNFFQWKDLDDSPEKFGGSAGANRSTERNPLQELQRRFGHRQFRGGQRECIEAALEARDVYCLMPTGKK